MPHSMGATVLVRARLGPFTSVVMFGGNLPRYLLTYITVPPFKISFLAYFVTSTESLALLLCDGHVRKGCQTSWLRVLR